MKTIRTADELRRLVDEWRHEGARVALVPTMGNLHEGHIDLVRAGQARADKVVVSVFVNPAQFGPGEDFAAYPRTPRDDRRRLLDTGADVLFRPSVDTLYPGGLPPRATVEVGGLSQILCGASRPRHFTGVATVVTKLFNLVAPQLALFGEKDYQQLVLVRTMALELCQPVEIVGVPTRREADGLAMSSRNQYLTEEQRRQAPHLYGTLRRAAADLQTGIPIREVAAKAAACLRKHGFRPDYVEVRRAVDLAEPQDSDKDLVILAAAFLGRARLIDNLVVSLKT